MGLGSSTQGKGKKKDLLRQEPCDIFEGYIKLGPTEGGEHNLISEGNTRRPPNLKRATEWRGKSRKIS